MTVHRKKCEFEGCTETVPVAGGGERTSMWDLKRAAAEGWFIQKDGIVWCPKHVPEWVEDWRKRRDR